MTALRMCMLGCCGSAALTFDDILFDLYVQPQTSKEDVSKVAREHGVTVVQENPGDQAK